LRKVAVPEGARLACEVGAVRIGVAVCDRDGLVATPREAIPAGPHAPAQVAAEADAVGAVEIVVGLPISLDGSRGAAVVAVEAWIALLQEQTRIPVTTFDERLTTVQAQRRIRETGRSTRQSRPIIDSMAAVILLEAYLERLSGGDRP